MAPMQRTQPTGPDSAPTIADPRRRAVAAALVVLGIAATATAGARHELGGPPLGILLLAAAFAATQSVGRRVDVGRRSYPVTLGSVALVVGIVHLAPWALVVAAAIGGATSGSLVRRPPSGDAWWAAASWVARAGTAVAVVAALLGDATPDSALHWAAVLGGVVVSELVSIGATVAAAQADGEPIDRGRVIDIARAHLLGPIASSYAIIAVSVVDHEPAMLPFAVVPIVAFSMYISRSSRLLVRHRDLQRAQSLSETLNAPGATTTVDTGLRELVEIMRARGGGLVSIDGQSDDARVRVVADGALHDLGDRQLAADFVAAIDSATTTVLHVGDPDPVVGRILDRLGARTMLASPALGESDHRGIVFVTDHSDGRTHYSRAELRLFRSVAAAFSSRLSNDLLVERLHAQARIDRLTGLSNRSVFTAELGWALRDKAGAVLVIATGPSGPIGDTMAQRDRELITLADRLRESGLGADIAARIGEDEFAVLLRCDGRPEIPARVESVRRALGAPLVVDGYAIDVGATVGVACWPDHGTDPDLLLRRGRLALATARRLHRAIEWYQPGLDAGSSRRVELTAAVLDALAHDDLTVVYQPKVSVRSGEVTGVEAFTRWHHPDHGDVSPAEFVPLIAAAGAGPALSRFVLTQAIGAAKRFVHTGTRVPVSVNVSTAELFDPELPADVERMLDDASVAADLLTIELSHDAFAGDVDAVTRSLEHFRSVGVRISIDDFGTGYASVGHLDRAPVDELKIDRAYVARLDRDPSAGAIVRASISLANELGIVSVAEGVEDGATVRALAELGCSEIQGYVISRPRPIDDMAVWVEAWFGDPLLGWLSTVGDAGLLLDMAR